MVNFRRFVVFSCGILVLRFTASAAQLFTSIIVRPGGEVTLPCENVVEENCASTTWLFGRSPLSPSAVLVLPGRVVVSRTEPERLRVTANCSLVLKEVTEEDVGRYGCRNAHTSKDSQVELSVININTQTIRDGKKVKLTCSVTTYGNCSLTVKWLHFKTEEDKDNKDMKISDSACLSTLASTPHHVMYSLRKFLTCEVTDRRTHKVELFTFNPESTGKNKSETENKERKPPLEDPQQQLQLQWWWYFALAVVVLAVLLLSAVALVMWMRNRGNKSKMEETMADPGDAVAYASITLPPGISSQIRGGDCKVTYSTVNLSFSPARNSAAEPGNLYATVNKPHK
ncbi:uncharacterized protein LOC131443240 [Solea solea]|uniref:uncharacterized protein LOC131443240 n=1 Tax=Solea solea TaxID=90069 RepID=UPI00272A901B|nr:uncharacterized protein LOC131443240 [Solea solea]